MQLIPLNSLDNQTFQSSLLIDGAKKKLNFRLYFNEVCNYWAMDIIDGITQEALVSSAPLITGSSKESTNLLAQYSYLRIGSAYLINAENVWSDPDHVTLGINFLLAWGDTL